MSFRILNAAAMVEQDAYIHEARLLILLHYASAEGDGTIKGIMKLAKLDFLLRYPKYLRRLVARLRKRPVNIDVQPFEEDTIESRMIRFKYGPWDHRYRGWLALLYSKGLITMHLSGRTVHIRLTENGKRYAKEITELSEFDVLSRRGKVVIQVVGKESATRLKNLVYELVPEITGMAWGEEIVE